MTQGAKNQLIALEEQGEEDLATARAAVQAAAAPLHLPLTGAG